MRKELANRFNQEIEHYRTALLFYARKCDWDTFKMNAEKMFNYCEQIEFQELERRFFRIFNLILFVLVLAVAAIFKMDAVVLPADLPSLKRSFVLLAIAGSCYELYFFLNFRMYMIIKSRYYKIRKDRFIRNIENDFKKFILRSNQNNSRRLSAQ